MELLDAFQLTTQELTF